MAGTAAGASRKGKGKAPRGTGLRALGETVDRLTAPLIGSRRLLAADLALAWATIAGDRLAAATHPDRLVFPPKRRNDGTLHLRVASGAAALEMQHETGRLIDRINAHLGYAAVARLKVVQAPLPPRATAPGSPRPAPPSPSDAPAADICTQTVDAAIDSEVLAGIEDARLRSALAGLGRRLLADTRGAARRRAAAEACRDDSEPV
jgi:hypothetical protein